MENTPNELAETPEPVNESIDELLDESDSVDDFVDTDEEPELNEYTRTSIRQALKSYNVGVNDGWDNGIHAVEAERRVADDGSVIDEFEVSVNIAGVLDLEEVMEEQGLLMYCREGAEIELRGFAHENVRLDVIYDHSHN